MPFSNSSYGQSEKDKLRNVLVMFVVTFSEIYYHDSLAWSFDTDFISYGSKIPINEDLCDYYKNQGCALNDDDVPGYDKHAEDADNNDEECDPEQHNESDFDHEVDDSDSDYSVV